MKTTIEIADTLLEEARQIALREKTTVRALVEEGLRRVVVERKRPGTFRLRDASVDGRGLQPGVADASWDRIRELAYEGHGG
jgi:CRISPR/Cas system-associated protein Csm6